jgi:hypothetical protein
MIIESTDTGPSLAGIRGPEESLGQGSCVPDTGLGCVAGRQPEDVTHTSPLRLFLAADLRESRRAFRFDPVAASVRGTDNRRTEVARLGRHQHCFTGPVGPGRRGKQYGPDTRASTASMFAVTSRRQERKPLSVCL